MGYLAGGWRQRSQERRMERLMILSELNTVPMIRRGILSIKRFRIFYPIRSKLKIIIVIIKNANMKNVQFITILVILVALLGVTVFAAWPQGREILNIGGVSVGNEYTATTTPWNGVNVSHYLDKGWGTLGSVVITKAGDTEFYLLDATNTPELVDAYATSSDMLAHFPASAATGTYVFDVIYNDGLYFYVTAGNTGTSTITFR